MSRSRMPLHLSRAASRQQYRSRGHTFDSKSLSELDLSCSSMCCLLIVSGGYPRAEVLSIRHDVTKLLRVFNVLAWGLNGN